MHRESIDLLHLGEGKCYIIIRYVGIHSYIINCVLVEKTTYRFGPDRFLTCRCGKRYKHMPSFRDHVTKKCRGEANDGYESEGKFFQFIDEGCF